MATKNHRDCQDVVSSHFSRVRSIRYCNVLLRYAKWWQISTCRARYSGQIFIERVQVSAVHDVIECVHIHSYLQATTESHFLHGHYLQRVGTDGCPATGKRPAWTVTPALCQIIFLKISCTVFPYRYLQTLAEFHLPLAYYSWPISYRKMEKKIKRRSQTQSFANMYGLLTTFMGVWMRTTTDEEHCTQMKKNWKYRFVPLTYILGMTHEQRLGTIRVAVED